MRPPENAGWTLDSIETYKHLGAMVYKELFLEKVYEFSSIRFEPDAVLDCGGYHGYFTLLANVRFPSAKFLAFEPSPLNYKVMLSNFERNGLPIDARQQAVSIHSGAMMFSGEGAGGHLATTVDENSFQVEVVDLREIVSDFASRRLLLKLDVEGEENRILPELLSILPSTCAIFFEWHHSDSALRQIESSLQSDGFTTERNRTREGPDGVVYVDALAIRN
jgi:FkbM family methyltransferase